MAAACLARLLQTASAAACPNKDGSGVVSERCLCGIGQHAKYCEENQYCLQGEMLEPTTQIDTARTGQQFVGVNGQCSDSSEGPWYVGIVDGICEDHEGLYTITRKSSCQAGFDSGITAATGGITNRNDNVVTPLVAAGPWDWNRGSIPHDGPLNDACSLTGNNKNKGCYWNMADPTPIMQFQKAARKCPAGDPLVKRSGGTGRGWLQVCIKAPFCSNLDGTALNRGGCLCGTAAGATFVPTTEFLSTARTEPTLCQANNYCIFQDLPTNNHCVSENLQSNAQCDIYGRHKCHQHPHAF